VERNIAFSERQKEKRYSKQKDKLLFNSQIKNVIQIEYKNNGNYLLLNKIP
jgi:hypothetical protein